MKIVDLFFSKKQHIDLSLLIVRSLMGFLMLYLHGWGKLMSGSERWQRLGNGLSEFLHLDFLSVPLGFMASFSESIGAIFIILGFATRPAAFLLGFTMLIAVIKKLPNGLQAAELPFLFLTLCIIVLLCGAGKHSLDSYLFNKK